ncbi:hypothetical protein MARINON1_60017 [Marinobacter salarius]|jgi:hypothetical protein|nr:conserved hypothetical protein [Marinobacter salarius]VXC36192.1 hypothetical protein MARINON1_60017 [Marinobacter salarius]|tara:strand:+ start:530 stop:934 length:405 start_codon:yes stop_codon:yes gene_type:complete
MGKQIHENLRSPTWPTRTQSEVDAFIESMGNQGKNSARGLTARAGPGNAEIVSKKEGFVSKIHGRPPGPPIVVLGGLVASTQFDSFNCRIIAALDISLANTFGLRKCRESEYRKNEKELVDCVHVIFHLLRELD